MLRQRQTCSRQRYGGHGKINKTINTISIGDGVFSKKPRPQFNLSLFELYNFGIQFEKGKLAGILDIINEICYNSDTYKSR
mgnify:CR=1 FL=1